ncbi:RING-H2 finger protein ATL72 [Hibiscus syriacus]|uniref:RING-type E3 ubiquitin transferase n=1 Tax=Hibiscus syriacus TaxID=106335 RepID=A0A6A2YUR5_HIBSY|nr:RING-H2 finger protein ATL72 [Hibiscus syriacus]
MLLVEYGTCTIGGINGDLTLSSTTPASPRYATGIADKRKQNAPCFHQRSRFRHQHGHHPSSFALCIDMRSRTELYPALCVALRCGRRFGFDVSDETAPSLATARGLKSSALRQIPVVVYSSGMNMKAMDCPICLGEFMDGEKVRVLPKCNHGFHLRCIDTWLMSHSSCPTCRRSLSDQATSSGAMEVTEDGIRKHGHSSGGQQAVVLVAADEVG